MVPAVSQGAIAVETRGNDASISSLISKINHLPTFITVNAERSFLRALEGGCQFPIGCFSELKGTRLKISGIVSNTDGTQVMRESVKGEISNAEKMALLLAKKFLDKGALELIRNIRTLNQK
jgi:hydroxymethylbilane synthase